MRDTLDEAFAAQRLKPPVPCVEGNSSIRVQLLMEERNYLSILSAMEVQLYRPLGILETIRLSPAIEFPNIGAIWEMERMGPLLSNFLDALRAESQVVSQVKLTQAKDSSDGKRRQGQSRRRTESDS